jgi:hypothetical protein
MHRGKGERCTRAYKVGYKGVKIVSKWPYIVNKKLKNKESLLEEVCETKDSCTRTA